VPATSASRRPERAHASGWVSPLSVGARDAEARDASPRTLEAEAPRDAHEVVAVAHVRDVEIHGRGNAPWAAHAVAIAVAVQIEVPHLGTADVDFLHVSMQIPKLRVIPEIRHVS
jgi:hypothetical protein